MMNLVVGHWGEIAGILAAFSAALSSLQVRAVGTRLHPFVTNALRCLIATIGFALFWFFGSREPGNWLQAVPLLVTVVVFGLVVGDSLYFAAISKIGPGKATPIAMSYPLPTAILAAIVYHEQISALQFAGIALGVAAIWIIASAMSEVGEGPNNLRQYWIGVTNAVLASLCWSVSILVLRPALALVPLDFANLVRMGLAATIIPVFGYSAFRNMTLPTGRLRIGVLIAGMGVTAVTTSYFLTTSIHQSGAGVASLLSSMAPVFAAPMAWFFFAEAVTPRTALAIVLGMLGILLVVTN